MKQEDVPQDALILDDGQEIIYAVDKQGHYFLTPSAGWDAKNLANIQAWQLIADEIEGALEQIRKGVASPLIFHMARNQMDAGLLARYVQLSRWRVKRHLQLKHYQKMPEKLRKRYAAVFQIPVEALDEVPRGIELPVILEIQVEEKH